MVQNICTVRTKSQMKEMVIVHFSRIWLATWLQQFYFFILVFYVYSPFEVMSNVILIITLPPFPTTKFVANLLWKIPFTDYCNVYTLPSSIIFV